MCPTPSFPSSLIYFLPCSFLLSHLTLSLLYPISNSSFFVLYTACMFILQRPECTCERRGKTCCLPLDSTLVISVEVQKFRIAFGDKFAKIQFRLYVNYCTYFVCICINEKVYMYNSSPIFSKPETALYRALQLVAASLTMLELPRF